MTPYVPKTFSVLLPSAHMHPLYSLHASIVSLLRMEKMHSATWVWEIEWLLC